MSSMRKRYCSLFLAGCLLLAGCGGSKAGTSGTEANNSTETGGPQLVKTEGTVSLRVWGPEADAELLATVIEKFKAQYGSEANFEFTVEAVEEKDTFSAVLMDVNNAPDVFSFVDDQLSPLASSGVLKPITVGADDVRARNSEGSVAAASLGDSMYAYPLTADNGYFLYYNKKYFKESDMATLDGILKVAEAAGKKVTMDFTAGWYLYSMFGNTGLSVGLNENGISNHCDWNSTDGEIKGVDVAKAMIAIGKSKGFQCGGDDILNAGAKNDTVIAGVSGVWDSVPLAEAWGDNLGAVKLPTYTVAGKQIQMSSYAGYKLVGVNSYSPNAYWAETFAEFLTNEENQMLRFELRGQGPSNTVAASSEAVSKSVAIQALIQQSEFASLQRIGAAYWDPAGELGGTLMNGGPKNMSLQDFMDKIVEGITASY